MMLLSKNLFLLFKFNFLGVSEFGRQIKSFRLKYVFLAGNIIRSARYVVMKLPGKYPYKDVYKKCLYNFSPKIFRTIFLFIRNGENISE
jgi:hypothetical protein